MIRRRGLTLLAILQFAVSVTAQVATTGSNQSVSPGLKRAAVDKVEKLVNATRASAKLPPLKRVRPSKEERELVCTAARTGRKVHDPAFGDLGVYVTDDLSRETETLRTMALGKRCPTCSPAYPEKWRRLSVIVEVSSISAPDHPLYTVGIAVRPSAALELIAPLGFDNPFAGNEWKKQVVAECCNPSGRN
jgi:hypothetical protein